MSGPVAVRWSAAGSVPAVVAIDVGGMSIKGALFHEGSIVTRIRRGTFQNSENPLGNIVQTIGALLRHADAAGVDVAGIGIACPGTVDASSGRVVKAVNLGWNNEPLAHRVTDVFSLPTVIDHDARAAARAEAASRNLLDQDSRSLAFIPIGTGISASLIIDGVLLAGHSGLAGEFGHMRIIPDGDLCACGQRGCLESYASAGGIQRRYRAAGGEAGRTTKQIVQSQDRDPIAHQIWREGVDALATGVAALAALLDPSLILLGGGLSLAGNTLLYPARQAVAQALPWRPPPPIQLSALGPDAGLHGAALLAQPIYASTTSKEMR